jgi:hypothetical protein
MQTGSPNVDHEYQKPIEELNMLLLKYKKLLSMHLEKSIG